MVGRIELFCNSLIAEAAYRLIDMGEEPPVVISGNYVQKISGQMSNMRMVSLWSDGNPHLPLLCRCPPLS